MNQGRRRRAPPGVPRRTVDMVGLNFLLDGGDAYPAVPFTNLGISDQQALQTYIEGTLGGAVTAAQYPRGGDGRITII